MNDPATKEDFKPMQQALRALLTDLNTRGWDQPHSFFSIGGTIQNPTFDQLVELPIDVAHPIDFLNFVHHVGQASGVSKLPPDSIGLLLVNEAWAALPFDKVETAAPDFFKKMMDYALTLVSDEPAARDAAEAAYRKTVETLGSEQLARVQPDLTVELRQVTVVMKSGWVLHSAADRNGLVEGSEMVVKAPSEIATETETRVMVWGGRIPDGMRRFLNNLTPDPSGEKVPGQAKTTGLPNLSDLLKKKGG